MTQQWVCVYIYTAHVKNVFSKILSHVLWSWHVVCVCVWSSGGSVRLDSAARSSVWTRGRRGEERESESGECVFFLRSVRVWWQSGGKTLKSPAFSRSFSLWGQSVSLLVEFDADLRDAEGITLTSKGCFVTNSWVFGDGDCEWAVCLQLPGISLPFSASWGTFCSHRWVFF